MFANDYGSVSPADNRDEPSTSLIRDGAEIHQTLVLGCGAMGSALLTRWAAESSHNLLVTRRRHRAVLPEQIAVVEQPLQLPKHSLDYLVIAVKPQQISSAVEPWLSRLKKSGTLISVAAGVSVATLRALTGVERIVRLMPNLAVRVGRGICGLYSTDAVPASALAGVTKLLRHTGEIVTVEQEADLDRITAVAGSGTGFALEVASSYAESIRRLGFDARSAERLAVETLLGAALLASESDVSPEQLRDQVTSAGGTTASGLTALRESTRLDLAFDQTFQAALRRAFELR